jgi:hypothetical protein
LARYILDHMNWSLCEQGGHELFLSGSIHSQTAVFIVQAYFHHIAVPQAFFSFSSSRSLRTEFLEWCFVAILRTRHWTHDGAPMAEQLDLNTNVGKCLLDAVKDKAEPDILSIFACLELTHIGRKPASLFESLNGMVFRVVCSSWHVRAHNTPLTTRLTAVRKASRLPTCATNLA